jgi:nicotinate-nucleotide--dimethylbenzimidazole phosphoribosyltransferase
VLQQALAANRHAIEPQQVLAALGGLEIATLAGAVLAAAAERRVILVDGFICTAAVAARRRAGPGRAGALRVRARIGGERPRALAAALGRAAPA